jgi:hypothetical protein
VVAQATIPATARVASPSVGDAALTTALGRLLLALPAALDDVLDAHAAPRQAGRGAAVLEVAWVGVRVGVPRGGLVLALTDGLFACDLGLFACVKGGERVSEMWRLNLEMESVGMGKGK